VLVDRTERAIGSMGGFGGSVREIEGVLNQIDAVHRLIPELSSRDGVVGVLLVRRALGICDESQGSVATVDGDRKVRRPVAGEVVLSEICKAVGVEVLDVHGKGRHARVVLARGLVAYLCRTLTTLSFPEIAGIMGRDNHSTVITAFKRFERQMAAGEGPQTQLPQAMAGMSLREMSEVLARQIAKAAY
jgi:chromosomal replication initiator protein